ncbi:MAG: hypothetical protein ABTQ25_20655 [Nitrosomonas ureae]
MNKTQPKSEQKSVESAQPTGIARRRLLRAGLATVPLALAVSGRSAMAGTSCDAVKGLSPLAWASMAPNGTCVGSSHTITGNPLGKSPGYWTPNANGNGATFQTPYRWPVAPFDRVSTVVGNGNNAVYMSKSWEDYPYLDFKGVAKDDPGFANGAKFNSVFGGSEGRSFSRILLDESANGNVEWHFSAAYLNCLVMNGQYAMTSDELKYLYANRQLVAGGVMLSDSAIKTFLDQTWG